CTYPDYTALHAVLAGAVFNALVGEDDPGRRDAALVELRVLARTHPAVVVPLAAAVRDELDQSLLKALEDSNNDDPALRDALLGELRALARAYPDHAGVHYELATGLFNSLLYAEVKKRL